MEGSERRERLLPQAFKDALTYELKCGWSNEEVNNWLIECFDLDPLLKLATEAIKDQYLIRLGYNREPFFALGNSFRFNALRQNNGFRQHRRFVIQADDKQSNYQYNAANHHRRQYCHQTAQESQLRGFFNLLLRGQHGRVHYYLCGSGRSAAAP